MRHSYLSSHFKNVGVGYHIPREAIVGLRTDSEGTLSLLVHLLLIRANMLGSLESC